MTRTRTTLTIDEEVLKAVKVGAARTGKGDSEIIEDAIRRDLGLDLVERFWAGNDTSDGEAMDLALEARQVARREARGWRQFSTQM